MAGGKHSKEILNCIINHLKITSNVFCSQSFPTATRPSHHSATWPAWGRIRPQLLLASVAQVLYTGGGGGEQAHGTDPPPASALHPGPLLQCEQAGQSWWVWQTVGPAPCLDAPPTFSTCVPPPPRPKFSVILLIFQHQTPAEHWHPFGTWAPSKR